MRLLGLLCLAPLLAVTNSASPLALAAAEASQRTSLGCAGAVPERTVLLTYTNGHHFELLLQNRRIAAEAQLHCLQERTVTVCLDDECSALCREHGLRHAPTLPRPQRRLSPSPHSCVRYSDYTIGAADARTDRNYRTITFLKWLMLYEVSGSVAASLFYDDDVMFFSNPFLAFAPSSADFRHQTEAGAGCAARPNGGLLFVRSSPQGVQLLQNMVARRAEIEASGDKLDQDYVEGAALAAGVSRCALPKALFAGHCRRAQERSAQVGGLVTYHAHCCSVRDSKLALVERIVAARRETPTRTLREVDLVPLPGFTASSDACYKGWLG